MMDALEQDTAVFWSLVFRIVLDVEKRLTAQLASHGLTPPQFYVLKTLTEHNGRCPIGEIARQHHLTNATMTGLVSRMEAAAPPLVMRQPHDSDRRSVYVMLTPEGEARYLAVQADLMAHVRLILKVLTPEERQDLLNYVTRYADLIAALPMSGA